MRGGWDSAAARWDIGVLAHLHRVDLFRSKRWAAEASPTTRQVWAPLGCRSGIDYLICLHELGHVVSPLSRRLCLKNAQEEDLETGAASEAAAWAWGIKHGDPNVLALVSAHEFELAAQCWLSHVRPLAGTVPV